MKQSKAEQDFFRDFDHVEIKEVHQEPWERFLVKSLDYLYQEPVLVKKRGRVVEQRKKGG